jgi:hypothetical protein
LQEKLNIVMENNKIVDVGAETEFRCSSLEARLLSGQEDIHSYPGRLWLHTKSKGRGGNERKEQSNKS